MLNKKKNERFKVWNSSVKTHLLCNLESGSSDRPNKSIDQSCILEFISVISLKVWPKANYCVLIGLDRPTILIWKQWPDPWSKSNSAWHAVLISVDLIKV